MILTVRDPRCCSRVAVFYYPWSLSYDRAIPRQLLRSFYWFCSWGSWRLERLGASLLEIDDESESERSPILISETSFAVLVCAICCLCSPKMSPLFLQWVLLLLILSCSIDRDFTYRARYWRDAFLFYTFLSFPIEEWTDYFYSSMNTRFSRYSFYSYPHSSAFCHSTSH